ncbi:MAG: hypothetical protein DRJ64_02760 [Thermoprotei archaeon]|nr:MAG: hypothetical protein DRJ64_02760 [Thermoprotei archaeon]
MGLNSIFIFGESNNNEIIRNLIKDNEHGLRILKSENNLVEDNTISGSLRCDIRIEPGFYNILFSPIISSENERNHTRGKA